jgi:hypothetical protein
MEGFFVVLLFFGDGNIAGSNKSNRAENGSGRNPRSFWFNWGEREVRFLVIDVFSIISI